MGYIADARPTISTAIQVGSLSRLCLERLPDTAVAEPVCSAWGDPRAMGLLNAMPAARPRLSSTIVCRGKIRDTCSVTTDHPRSEKHAALDLCEQRRAKNAIDAVNSGP